MVTSRHAVADHDLVWWRPKRILAVVSVAALIPISAIAGSYLFNQMLFTFGPWADLFWEQVALALLVLLVAVAYLSRDLWLPPAPRAPRRGWPDVAVRVVLVPAVAIAGGYLGALLLSMYTFWVLPSWGSGCQGWIDTAWVVLSVLGVAVAGVRCAS